MATKTGTALTAQEIESEVLFIANNDAHLTGVAKWKAYEAAKRRISEICKTPDQYEMAIRQYRYITKI